MKQTTQSTYDNFDTQILNTLNIRILNSGSLLTKTPPKKFSVYLLYPWEVGGTSWVLILAASSSILVPSNIFMHIYHGELYWKYWNRRLDYYL